jgi:pimeloyl-ACP methyl ester carboxylesterase
MQINFCANWVPQNLKTLIIGAEFDAMTPVSLFENDSRFSRSNISIIKIHGAGHMPWFEKMEDVVRAIKQFETLLPIKDAK